MFRAGPLRGLIAQNRIAALATLPNILLAMSAGLAIWFVLVPLAALIYNAFTEDTGFGPGPFSLDNFVEAYGSWHIMQLSPTRSSSPPRPR
jgi:hypothetical protein